MLDAKLINENTIIDEVLASEGGLLWNWRMATHIGETIGSAIRAIEQDASINPDTGIRLARLLRHEIEVINQIRTERSLMATIERDPEHRNFFLRMYCHLCEQKGWVYRGGIINRRDNTAPATLRWVGPGWYAKQEIGHAIRYAIRYYHISARQDTPPQNVGLEAPIWYDEPPLDMNVSFT